MLKLISSSAYGAHHVNPAIRVGSSSVKSPLFKALGQLTGLGRAFCSNQSVGAADVSDSQGSDTKSPSAVVSTTTNPEDCLTDPKLLAALEESRKRQAPYAGAFLLKDDASTDSSSSTSETDNVLEKLKGKELLSRIHEVGTLAQVSEDPLSVKVDHIKDNPHDKDDDAIKATYYEVMSTLRDVLKTTSLWRDQAQKYTQDFDEYMNLVLDEAEEVSIKKNTRKPLAVS